MTVTKVLDEEKKERQQKFVVIALFSICIIGFSYLVYDYFDIVNHEAMPEDFAQVNKTIDGWKSNGLVSSFDPAKEQLVVNEERWNKLSKKEKIGIVTQLARYCAAEKQRAAWKFEVVGSNTSTVVGQLGSKGLVIP